MLAKDVMSRPVHILRPDDTIEQAAATLTSRGFTSAPVLSASGELLGMVSEVDLLPRPLPGSTEPESTRSVRPVVVADVMSMDVVVVSPDTELGRVVKTMLDAGVRCVPVYTDGELSGVVSRRDILRCLVRDDDAVQAELQNRLDDYAGSWHSWVATVTGGQVMITGEFEDVAQQRIVDVLARTVPGVASVSLCRSPGPPRTGGLLTGARGPGSRLQPR